MRDPTIFNCPNWDGTGFRYYTSVLCATLVAQGIGNTDTPTPCNPAGTVVPICDSTVSKYITAYQVVYQNRATCPDGANGIAQALVNNVIGMRSAGLFSSSSSTTCFASESNESNNC
ncbi:UNVERIFIED_CONTAM: hypothetical protein HDU68_001553, partial [Siphonaria sp. JEL0065]